MKTLSVSISFMLLHLGSVAAFSQVSTNPNPDPRDPRPEYVRDAEIARGRQNERVKKIVEQADSVRIGPTRRRKSPTAEERKAAEREKREAVDDINKVLSAPPEYKEKYAEFLKGKKTGIARLFPDRGCDKGKVVSVVNLERCSGTAPIWGTGSLYSFRLNELPSNLELWAIHGYIRASDIHFIDGKFEVGTEWIQDIIADIGEVELSQVTLSSDSVKYLRSFEPAATAKKLNVQKQEFAKGVNHNGFTYVNSVPVTLNRTYVLRSIAFKGGTFRSFWNTDTITSFKVIGQEDDGSVVLLWKELRRSGAPFLKK